MFTVIYNLTNGTNKYQDFKDPVKAFDLFYALLPDARKDPFVASDEHIGFFTHKDVDWYMMRDREGKDLAKIRFLNWIEDFKRCA